MVNHKCFTSLQEVNVYFFTRSKILEGDCGGKSRSMVRDYGGKIVKNIMR